MPKVVVNRCFGGFGISDAALHAVAARKGLTLYPRVWDNWGNTYYTDINLTEESFYSDYDLKRDDPDLVAVVEEMGKASWGRSAELRIAEVPDDVEWTIQQYDGQEWVSEVHRTW